MLPAMPAAQTQGNRRPLHEPTQQHASRPAAALLAMQLEPFAEAGTLSAESDLALCDADGGTFVLDLPGGANLYVGKPYAVREQGGTNSVTVRPAAGAGTIDGAATLTLPAGEGVVLVPVAVAVNGEVTWLVHGQTAGAGGERLVVSIPRLDLLAGVWYYVHRGPDATLESIDVVQTAALATDDATITATINGVAVTDGVVTVSNPGSAGDVSTATPSANNVISAGQVLALTVGGGNTDPAFGDVSLAFTY